MIKGFRKGFKLVKKNSLVLGLLFALSLLLFKIKDIDLNVTVKLVFYVVYIE